MNGSMKLLPKSELPREKLAAKGVENLRDDELLAIMLRTGKEGLNVLELSKKILAKTPMKKLLQLSYQDLVKVNGIDSGKACSLLAGFELTRRALNVNDTNLPVVNNPDEAIPLLGNLYKQRREHFVVMYLNARCQVINKETISIGTINSTIIHPREVFEPAVRCLAAQIILAHNHPSGDLEPSEHDEEITKQIVEAGKIMGIEIMDHLIISHTGYFSFREEGFFDKS